MSTGKKTLFAFGDSFTFGHGFPDCLTNITGPSTFSYPNLLAKKNGYDLVNLSRPGSSPIAQFYRFHFRYPEIQAGDIVTFLWPYSMRSAILCEKNPHQINDNDPFPIEEINIMPGTSTSKGPHRDQVIDIEKWYTDYTTEFHNIILLSTYMNSVEQMCKARDIKCIQLLLHCMDLQNLQALQELNIEHTNHFRDWKLQPRSLESYVRIDRLRNKINKFFNLECGFLPDGHFNADAHKFWAHIFSKHIDRVSN